MKVASSGAAKVTLPSDEEILITREFNARPELVYRAWTTPDLVRRWWSGRQGRTTSAEIDLRVGGRWRYAMVADGGQEVAFHGEFRELVPNERIVTTEIYETPEGDPPPGEEVLNLVTFTATGDRTTMALLVRCPSREVRDQILESGMEVGMQEAYDLLDEVAAGLT